MNISNLRQKNVDIALASSDETIEIYLSITQCACSRPLSDALIWDHRVSVITFGKY